MRRPITRFRRHIPDINRRGRRVLENSADLVLSNAAICTMDPAMPWARSVAVRKGSIICVGSDAQCERFIGPATSLIDLAGQMVLPGFQDTHIHPVTGGLELLDCHLQGLSAREEIVAAVAHYAASHPGAKWIRGSGWEIPIFPGDGPRKEWLDSAVADRPVYLEDAGGHSAWVNSRALEAAGISAETSDPSDGRIERDPTTREPTGCLREAGAMDLVRLLGPDYTPADYLGALRLALGMAARFGLTSLHEADADEPRLIAYQALERDGELTARIIAALHVDAAAGPGGPEVVRLSEWRQQYGSSGLRPIGAKLFVDGVLETHTAALLESYFDRPDYLGSPAFDQPLLDRWVAALEHAGFQVHVHAIGDRAARMSLNAFEAARLINGRRDTRHMIAHLEVVHPRDIPRFRPLGVIAAVQPLWAMGDEYAALAAARLGPARVRWHYPIASLARSGALVVGGSDWSVSSMNPLEAIQVALTRQHPSGGPVLLPEERLDLPTALAAYTINAAYANHQEQTTGSIEVGKAADLVVLDRNLFEVPVQEIHRVQVRMTLLNGRVVYGEGEKKIGD